MTESIQTESIQTESGFTEPETVKSGRPKAKARARAAATAEPADQPIAPVLNTRHAALRYTTLRLALFIICLAVLWGSPRSPTWT